VQVHHVLVAGLVQGVGFRAFTKKQAQVLGVQGWVRNLADGRVEALLSGNQTQIDAMIKALGEGPSFARVDKLERRMVENFGEKLQNTFSIEDDGDDVWLM
jgi:acylphosphatase